MAFKTWLAEALPGCRYMGSDQEGLKEAITSDEVFVARKRYVLSGSEYLRIEKLSDRGRDFLKSIRWETKPIPVPLRKARPQETPQ